jgi:hypothetical protein
VSPLIDLLETSRLVRDQELPGRYDERHGVRVDDDGHAIVEFTGATNGGTETRGGPDRDDGPPPLPYLGTLTKQHGTDRDETLSLSLTKTAGGRDSDDDRLMGVLLNTITFSGPDRD